MSLYVQFPRCGVVSLSKRTVDYVRALYTVIYIYIYYHHISPGQPGLVSNVIRDSAVLRGRARLPDCGPRPEEHSHSSVDVRELRDALRMGRRVVLRLLEASDKQR